MEGLFRVVTGLLGLAFVPLTGFAVVCLARRRPWLAAALLGGVVAAGAGAVWYAATLGYGYRPDLRRVAFDSDAARRWFTAGLVLLTLGLPAGPLVVVARAERGGGRPAGGAVGGRAVRVLDGLRDRRHGPVFVAHGPHQVRRPPARRRADKDPQRVNGL